MPVNTMKKLSVVTLTKETGDLMRALQKLRCADICRTAVPPSSEDEREPAVIYDEELAGLPAVDTAAETTALSAHIAEVGRAADFLARFETKKKGLFTPVEEVSFDDFVANDEAAAEETVREALALAARYDAVEAAARDTAAELAALRPLEAYPLAIPEDKTAATVTVVGTLPSGTDVRAVTDSLDGLAAVLEKISPVDGGTAVACTAYRGDADETLRVLTACGFVKSALRAGAEDGFAAGRVAALEATLKEKEDELDRLRAEASDLSRKLPLVRTLADKLDTDAARLGATERVKRTEKTVLLTAWIPAAAQQEISDMLAARGDAYEITDPAPGEEAPIQLSNNRFASNFEPVLAMYSLPRYGTYDPTFVMSIFYMLIFGLMFADAGYGALLSLGCFLIIKFMKPRGSMKSFMMMFGLCGLSCTFMGILFGSYFGNLPSTLATTFRGSETWIKPLLFDPMNGQGPMYFLIISLVVGAIHLSAGLVIKMIILWKSGDRFGAIVDVGSWLVIFLGIGVYILLAMVIGVSGLAGIIIAGIGALTIVATAGRAEKNPVMKFLKGLLGLYGIVGYASDLLSYSRILSLCLASAVIANVVNLLGTLPGPGFGSVVGLLIASLLGHTLNMALNLLGTFVHTSRLQYIEFFGKFYEDGGRAFEPLTPHSKHVVFK